MHLICATQSLSHLTMVDCPSGWNMNLCRVWGRHQRASNLPGPTSRHGRRWSHATTIRTTVSQSFANLALDEVRLTIGSSKLQHWFEVFGEMRTSRHTRPSYLPHTRRIESISTSLKYPRTAGRTSTSPHGSRRRDIVLYHLWEEEYLVSSSGEEKAGSIKDVTQEPHL